MCSAWAHAYVTQIHISVTHQNAACVHMYVWLNVQIDLTRERKHTYGPNLKDWDFKDFLISALDSHIFLLVNKYRKIILVLFFHWQVY